ncbi:MAG: hypothetical protein WCW35_15510 [Bacteroidota bacterium]
MTVTQIMETIIHTYTTVQRAMEVSPPAINFLYGTYGVYQTAMLIAADMMRQGEAVVIIDAANVTDPFFIAGLFKSSGIEPEGMLQHGFISRCYTFYQVDVTITDGLIEFMEKVHSKRVLVFGLLDLIDDEQVAVADIRDILTRVKETLDHLKTFGITTLLVSTPLRFQLKEREQFFNAYKGISDVIYKIDTDYSHAPARRGRNGKTDRNRNTAHRQGTGTVGKLPPRAPKRTTGALR